MPTGKASSRPQFVGFWPRFLAYLIDATPITLAVYFIFYFFFGYAEIRDRFQNRAPGDNKVIEQYDSKRDLMRNLTFATYILLSAALEASAWQGSLGKRVLGIRVTDEAGQRLSFYRALARNSAKTLSAFVLGLGFLWIIWSERNQGWHDSLAHTLVTTKPKRKRKRPPRPAEPETFQI